LSTLNENNIILQLGCRNNHTTKNCPEGNININQTDKSTDLPKALKGNQRIITDKVNIVNMFNSHFISASFDRLK